MQLSKGSERVTITSKSPGKLFIAGEYAVVEPGHGAIVAAVSRYLTVTIDETTSVGTLTSTQNPDLIVEWTREGELFRAKGEHPYKLVEEAILVAEQYVREYSRLTNVLYSLSITSELDDSKRGIKYGLGSSGAVVVATIQAVLDFYDTPRTPLLVYKLKSPLIPTWILWRYRRLFFWRNGLLHKPGPKQFTRTNTKPID